MNSRLTGVFKSVFDLVVSSFVNLKAMKTIRLLILFLGVAASGYVYSQDTISRINSNCIDRYSRSAEANKYNVALVSDSVIITWRVEAGCGSRIGASIQRLTDTTHIKTFYTFFSPATCLCDYDLTSCASTWQRINT